jgi:integrase
MLASKSSYKYLSLKILKTQYGEMYQIRLNSQLDRKTIGAGNNPLQALNLALMVDEEIVRLVAAGNAIDIDHLKEMVKSEQEKTKAKKIGNLKLVEKDDIAVLWSKYVDFNQASGNWEQTTILTTIKTITNLVAQCPYQKLEQKNEIVQWLFSDNSRTLQTSKDRLKFIVAAIDWNSKQGNIPRKWGIEYRDLFQSIKIKTEKQGIIEDEHSIEIFSVKEIYQILNALKNDTYSRFSGKHSQYYKYAYFCWLTGCRPSEAIALKWENVQLGKLPKVIFCESQVNASGRIIKKKGTKTATSRTFPINPELMELLNSIPNKQGYVFKNCTGNPISQQALNGVWKNLLKAMGIKYRVPYQLRHTMISYHANNDYPIHKLAEIVGNSEKIIKEHYLKLDIERINLPDVIKS